jgi:hypothetical protein
MCSFGSVGCQAKILDFITLKLQGEVNFTNHEKVSETKQSMVVRVFSCLTKRIHE